MSLDNVQQICTIGCGVIALLNFFGIIIVYTANKMAFHKIMTNDIHHVNLSIKELADEQKGIGTKVGVLAEDVAYLKGSLSIRRSSKAKKVSSKK